MKYSKVLVSAILAGMCIALGGMVYLSVDNKIVGSALFTVGLFVVCTQGFNLFTGKACYLCDNDRDYAFRLVIIWLGNLCGTGLIAGAICMTPMAFITEKAAALCDIKLNDSLLSLFVLGVLCNIFIYIAVEGFKSNPHELGKYLALFLGVMVFILCGTEHCVADMFYFWLAGWSLKAFIALMTITLGNLCGSLVFPLLKRLI